MSVIIPKNAFYKKKFIDNVVQLDERFVDLPSATDATNKLATIGNGSSPKKILLTGSVPSTPNYGEAKLDGGYLTLFPSTVDNKNSRSSVPMDMYPLIHNTVISGGAFSLAINNHTGYSESGTTVGGDYAVYSSYANPESFYISENFEGANVDIGSITRQGPNTMQTYSEPFIDINDFVAYVNTQNGTNIETTEFSPSSSNPLEYYKQTYATQADVRRYGTAAAKNDIGDTKLANNAQIKIWFTKDKSRWYTKFSVDHNSTNTSGELKYTVAGKDNKYPMEDLRNIVNYRAITSSQIDLDATPAATTNNTIFNDYASTRINSNPYDGDDNAPMIDSVVELSTANSLNAGQALRFYHNWGYSPNNPQIDKEISLSGNLNPQCSRTSLYNIPFPPLPFEIAQNTISSTDATPIYGNHRGTAPEIQLDMNIVKMDPTIQINLASGASLEDPYLYAKQANITTRGEAGINALTYLRSVVVTFSNYKPKAEHITLDDFIDYGLSNFYSGGGSLLTVGSISAASAGRVAETYTVTTEDYTITAGGGTGATFSVVIDGLGAATVTILDSGSSYHATETFTILGTFFGGATPANDLTFDVATVQPGDNIVGGVSFFRAGMGGVVDTSVTSVTDSMYAMPLPVGPVTQALSGAAIFTGGTVGGNKWLNEKSTILKESGLARITGVSSATENLNRLSNLKLVSPGDIQFGNNTVSPQLQTLPMNSWFKMRIFNSPTFNNGDFSSFKNIYNVASPGTIGQGGSTMRIIFETNTAVAGESDSQTTDLPFLDIPFPYGTTNSPTGDATSNVYNWTDKPEYYPRHMTIWVQNFPWLSDASSDDTTASATGYLWNYNYGNGTLSSTVDTRLLRVGDNTLRPSGAARELEVYIDNVKLVNYEPTVRNTTRAGNIAMKPRAVFSPLSTIISGNAYKKSWVFSNNGTLVPGSNKGELYQYNAGQQICIGFDDKGDLPINSDSNLYEVDAAGYVLFNDFGTSDWDTMSVNPMNESLFKSAYFKDPLVAATAGGIVGKSNTTTNDGSEISIVNGGQMFATDTYVKGLSAANHYDVVSGTTIVTNPTGAVVAGEINLGAGANTFRSVDAFRQKGFAYVSVDSTYNNFSRWTKRENILVSTKITNIPTIVADQLETSDSEKASLGNNAIQVSNPDVFNYTNPNETYIIYKMGYSRSNINKITGLKLDSNNPPKDSTITFTTDLTDSDDSTLLLSEENLPWLWIGPEKYWVSMLWDTPPTLTPRTYSNICGVNEVPNDTTLSQLGSTMNESVYTYETGEEGVGGGSALYKRAWNLFEGSSYLSGQDYGMEGLPEGVASNTEMYYNQHAYFNIDNYLNSSPISNTLTSPLPMLLEVGAALVEEVTVFTDDETDEFKKPVLYIRYVDLPPVVDNFEVSSAVNTITGDTDLYALTTENINAVQFTWGESNAKDVWYRMLIVDDENIQDKYHKASMWLPLNESGSSLGTAPPYKVYNNIAGVSALATTESLVRGMVEGQGGYAARLDSSAATGKVTVAHATNYTNLRDLTEFTLSVHYTPSVADLNTLSYICTATTSTTGAATGNFEMFKRTDNKIEIVLGANVSLISNSSIVCDNDVPTSIIVTYNESASSPIKAKLYINGTLENSSTGVSKQTTEADFVVGGDTGTYRGTTGMVEEIVLNNIAFEIVEKSKSYLYNTVDTVDVVGGVNINHNARLIVADYHNFRGGIPEDIGISQQIAWRTTT